MVSLEVRACVECQAIETLWHGYKSGTLILLYIYIFLTSFKYYFISKTFFSVTKCAKVHSILFLGNNFIRSYF